jgi:hypothetical protein
LLVGLAALGCGSSGKVDAAAASASSSASSASSSSSSSGVGGGSSSSSSSGAGGADPCEGAFFKLDGDGPTQMLNTGCWYEKNQAFNKGPVAYYYAGTKNLGINACGGTPGSGQELTIGVKKVDPNQPATASSFIDYVDASGASLYAMDPLGEVTFTTPPSMVGLPVEGSFVGAVSKLGGPLLMLSGTFRVCRVSDRTP